MPGLSNEVCSETELKRLEHGKGRPTRAQMPRALRLIRGETVDCVAEATAFFGAGASYVDVDRLPERPGCETEERPNTRLCKSGRRGLFEAEEEARRRVAARRSHAGH